MIRALALAATIAAVCCGAPATAQRDTQLGSRLNPRQMIRVEQDPKAAAAAAHRFAGCVYLKQRAETVAALDATQPDDAMRRLGKLKSKGTCINLLMVNDFADTQSVQLPGDIYRGMLAEAVFHDKYRGVTPPAMKLEAEYSRPWFVTTGRPRDIDEMSVCVAETDPAGVERLLDTTAETDGELAAVRSLGKSLGPCLATGMKLSSNRQSLRAGLAEALYHRLATPAVPATGEGK